MQHHEAAFIAIQRVCARAWEKGLLTGFNGNVSLRIEGNCYVTQSGAAKGYLRQEQIAVVRLDDGQVLHGTPSSELGMHLAIYGGMPDISCVVHTHPRHLLALELAVAWEDFLRLPLFEAERLRAELGHAAALPPGTVELAHAVAAEQRRYKAVWLARHGLCVAGRDLTEAVALSEELEHLAAIQLLSRRH